MTTRLPGGGGRPSPLPVKNFQCDGVCTKVVDLAFSSKYRVIMMKFACNTCNLERSVVTPTLAGHKSGYPCGQVLNTRAERVYTLNGCRGRGVGDFSHNKNFCASSFRHAYRSYTYIMSHPLSVSNTNLS